MQIFYWRDDYLWPAACLTLLLVAVDYLARLNTTFNCYFPLPIGGGWLDALFPKTLSVCVGKDGAATIKSYLQRAVRKGETFICFSDADCWTEPELPRLAVGKVNFRPLRKITCSADRPVLDSDYVFESAWFGRYCFMVERDELARAWLPRLERFLQPRHATPASARPTINIVCDLPPPIAADRLPELLFLCRETNHKLLVTVSEEDEPRLAPLFEECR